MSVGRGNGKSALVAGIATATIDPEGPLRQRRAETVIVASSFEQGRINFEHVMAFMQERGHDLENRKRWRVWDTAHVVNHGPTFRNCGASALLSPWKVRRAGAI